ncbi:MBG-2 domain-containing protein, partial [Acinetobacter guerrae]|uniref:MBG-2 domain-containing protein n=1 Tax=Acinetobacter guerrae TaxID=1843371 RepID=UPI00148F01A9
YNGKDQTVTGFTATGLVNGETESVLTGVTASGTGKNAGSYSSKATGSDNNYNLTFIDGSLDIAKAQ